MSLSWYPMYPGDYLKATMHLSLEEHGAYRLLMDIYYSTGQALPADTKKLSRLLHVSTRKTSKLMDELASFFEEKDGLLYHAKIEFEIDKSLKKHKTAVANGRAGGKANAIAKAQATRVATTTTTTKNIKDSSKSSDSDNRDFDEFWKNYPRKDAKIPSRRAFLRLNKTKRQLATDDCKTRYAEVERQFIPIPTTYIHGERWNDSNIITQAAAQNSIKWPAKGDGPGWVSLAIKNGISTKPGESQYEFEIRVRNKIGGSDE